MHLLVAQSGTIDDGAEPRDLGQTPGDIVVLMSSPTSSEMISRMLGRRVPRLLSGGAAACTARAPSSPRMSAADRNRRVRRVLMLSPVPVWAG